MTHKPTLLEKQITWTLRDNFINGHGNVSVVDLGWDEDNMPKKVKCNFGNYLDLELVDLSPETFTYRQEYSILEIIVLKA